MTVARQPVGTPTEYRGSLIGVTFMGPDYLAHVNEVELSGFFLTPMAAIAAGQRYIDDQLKDQRK